MTTRGIAGDDRLGALLEAAGARVVAWPTCAFPPARDPRPLEAVVADLGGFDWVVFTSARAVTALGERPAHRTTRSGAAGARGVVVARDGAARGGAARGVVARGGVAGPVGASAGDAPVLADAGRPAPTVAVVGPATARAATEAGWAVAVEGRGPGARGLAAQVAATRSLAGARVLFPAASGAAATVEEEFTELGARVTRVEAYRTVVTPPPAERVRADLAAGVDAIAFASPSAVEAVDRALAVEVDHPATDGSTVGDSTRALGPATGSPGVESPATGDTARALGRATVGGDSTRELGRATAGGDTARALGRATAGGEESVANGRVCPAEVGELGRALAGIAVVCIGPTTAAALARRGVAGVRVAAAATLEGMVDALAERFGGAGRPRGAGRPTGAAPRGRATEPRGAGRPDADLGHSSNTGVAGTTRTGTTRTGTTRAGTTRAGTTRADGGRSGARP